MTTTAANSWLRRFAVGVAETTADVIEPLFKVIQNAPTTPLRSVSTIAIWVTIGISEVIFFLRTGKWVDIPWTLAGLLVTMSGLDAAQYFGKRKTHKQFADSPPAPVPVK